jgi:diguanylate cyclase
VVHDLLPLAAGTLLGLVAGRAWRRRASVRGGWFGALRGTAAPRFVAILEIHRFAGLRRDLGWRLANRVLAGLAERLMAELPGCEIGRTGRTTVEFAFRSPDAPAARAALERLADLLSEQVVDGVALALPILIGAAAAAPGTAREEVLDHAAAALAAAKATHRMVCFADDVAPAEPELDEVGLLRDLRRARDNGELQLVYQPKLRARTDAIDSAEALLRWQHPTRGAVPIETAIRLAESTGAIRALTDWVLDRALADQRRLAAAGHDLKIHVNVSGVVLPDADWARATLARLEGAGGRIGLEVTETALIADPDRALANLRAFAAAGVPIAIDDYGAGLSSLSYLKDLPAGELKIDRSFVSGLAETHRDPLLVRSTIDLAHALDMEVTAEGVDDPLALSLLRVMGCDLIQGYLIARPMPLDALLAFLSDFDADGLLTMPALPLRRPA